ncbi:MAG TPA: hypothetical protein VKA59_15905 [Vicinamibacterales bacterium]|nr:hypothetical protein [Vicinamibacterales bacterium]
MAWTKKEDEQVKSFEKVREQELKYIVKRQPPDGDGQLPKEDVVAQRLIGLAFSGGGIRSATTNLGIAQALSRMGILRLVDYLSTVSGGGYIGGCLISFLSVNRDHQKDAGDAKQFNFTSRDELKFGTNWPRFPFNAERKTISPAPGKAAEPSDGTNIVAHLRTHGDFLVARRSILKREALRAVGTLFGGLLYTVVITGLALSLAALLLLGAAHALSSDVTKWKAPDEPLPANKYEVQPTRADTELRITRTDTGGTVREMADPAFLDNITHRIGLIWTDMLDDITAQEMGAAFGAGVLASLVALVIFIAGIKVWKGPDRGQPGESKEDAFEVRLLRVAALMVWLAVFIVPYVNATVATTAGRGRAAWLLQPFFVVAGAYVSAFLAYGLIIALFGTAGLLWSRSARSLWGSYLAICLYALIVAVLFAVLPAAAYAAHAVGVAGVLAPIGSLVIGRLLMSRSVTTRAEKFELSKSALHVVLALVVAGLILFTMIEVGALAIDKQFVDPLNAPAAFLGLNRYALAIAIGGGALLVLSVLINLNRIGLHYFYRDRILETYLRSEVVSKPDLSMQTFLDTMEMRLKDVHGNQVDKAGTPLDNATHTPGNTAPYLLVSAALNLAGSRDLTRKDRKSGYFLFSKYFCGSKQTGYLETQKYAGGTTQLARALTVSGAAAGTGVGYQTFFAQSFLAAVFNIRLGQWVPNPSRNSGQRLAFWPNYIVREVFGLTNEWSRLVNVSDGGHTGDNVGIYPLLERRCQVIIACDAEADPAIAFGSFTEALRQAYVDFGVDVDIDLSMILPDPTTGLSKAHCAIGRIRYPECPGRPNWLIYMKNSLTGNEPAPVLNYKRTSPAFPHESTADQFFDDSQFESYRALGDHIAEETLGRWIVEPEIREALRLPFTAPYQDADAAEKCAMEFPLSANRMAWDAWDDLLIHHSPFKAADSENFRELTKTLTELEQVVIQNPGLHAYYRECMLSADTIASRAADVTPIDPINLIVMQIQLMEDAYFSLRLDQYANAHDNRGWMNLFRSWARSKTFQQHFQQLQTVYSNDFVTFYCHYIDNWGLIDTEPLPHAWDVMHATESGLHTVAWECRRRGARGFFLDPGRREAREPDDTTKFAPQEPQPLSGQRGSTLATETPPPSSPPDSSKP